MKFENAVEVADFGDHPTAEAAVSLLQSEGIDAIISSDDAGGEMPNLGMARRVRVLVQSENEELARGLLNAGEGE
jgi:hypothetical protein